MHIDLKYDLERKRTKIIEVYMGTFSQLMTTLEGYTDYFTRTTTVVYS
jgi:hypothetical protein